MSGVTVSGVRHPPAGASAANPADHWPGLCHSSHARDQNSHAQNLVEALSSLSFSLNFIPVSIMSNELKDERKSRRKSLITALEALRSFHGRLSPDDLEKLGIQRLPMTLDRNPNGPKYFAAYDAPVEQPPPDASYEYPTFDWSLLDSSRWVACYLSGFFNHCILPNEESHPSEVSYSE